MKQHLNGHKLNSVTIQIFSNLKNTLDYEAIEKISEYFNGLMPDTLPSLF